MSRFYQLIIFSLILSNSFGQNTTKSSKTFSCEQILTGTDIENILTAGPVDRIVLKCSPRGSGRFQEVSSGKKKDKNYFKKEHNIVWIKFTAKVTGNLTFIIKPMSQDDDYDFLLFEDHKDFIKGIQTKKITPIRANISRNIEEKKGITGLDFSSKKTHNISGANSNFSKVLSVTKSENYFLAIDNVYNEGKGAIIYFDYYLTKKISGIIVNEEKSQFLNAEISWNDAETGETLITTITDSLTGLFEMEVPYKENNPKQKYVLSAYSKEHFFREKKFTTEEIRSHEFPLINILLPKLKKGQRNQLHNINFHGDVAKFLTGAYPSLKNLNKLMKRNKSLKILIEGHTNGCSNGIDFSQRLSEKRAGAVKKYLIENGISIERIETVGWNCKHMLFPNAKNGSEMSLNRRVEILVLDY
ncbi:MAG: OmpA family protein [Flavobacteriales bacterium]|nr:OmpA family protein [Flavobacteriales bacterium]